MSTQNPKNKTTKTKKKFFRKTFLLFFIACFVIFGLKAALIAPASAQGQIMVFDSKNTQEGILHKLKTAAKTAWDKAENARKILWDKAGAETVHSAVSSALNTIAYDTATWIGSGGKGQKPLFIREGWDEYLNNVADNAGGHFIEELNEIWGVDLCEPDIGLKLKIGLGLRQYQKPRTPSCTFSEMKNNWESELERGDFLPRFQDMFEPTSNEFGIALSLQSSYFEEIEKDKKNKEEERKASGGWLDVRNIAYRLNSPPGQTEAEKEQADAAHIQSMQKRSDNPFVDAANVFLNQLALSAFNNLMRSIGGGLSTYTNPYDGDFGIPDDYGDYFGGPMNQGVEGVQGKIRRVIQPKFNVRGDYDILGELSICPDPQKAGPTNCVIDDKFRQAVENRLTVGEALDQGYFYPEGVFGFLSGGLEPGYSGGYPYRSMIILRKFRIIPVGWELAAQYIKDNPVETAGVKSIKDLIDCYSDTDRYEGYHADWCEGLVDPTWVLKAPLNYCAREGYGPEIVSEQVTGEGYDSEIVISRDDGYCGDERSCIQEEEGGSCEAYGYCTKEKRKWVFDSESCEPKYNTCQSFKSSDGKTVALMENTLDYSGCSIDSAGCREYARATTRDDIFDNDRVDWNSVADRVFLNGSAEDCESDEEGCQEFERLEEFSGVEDETVYMKLVPNYLYADCYADYGSGNYLFAEDAPDVCDNYTRLCNIEEVGCKLYTSVKDDMEVPAKDPSLCPEECVGYNTYTRTETSFEEGLAEQFIPSTADACSIEQVGCDEFTNLDKIGSGAEEREYFTYLRQCTNDMDNSDDFYTWEGSSETGYQLRVFKLQIEGAEPFTIGSSDDEDCGDVYGLSVDDPNYDPDCREFYSKTGDIYYRYYSDTVTYSANCHPFRRSIIGTLEECVERNGTWEDGQGCIYMGVSNESKTCSASSAGCREYVGPYGANVRNVFTSNFDNNNGWAGGTLDSESLRVGENSYLVNGNITYPIGQNVAADRMYLLKFIARAVGGSANVSASFRDGAGQVTEIFSTSINNDWGIYEFSVNSIDHDISESEGLVFTGSGYNIDDIILTEISDRYYLVRDSWSDPVDCNGYLQCEAYETDDEVIAATGFGQLCQDSAIGCETMMSDGSPVNIAYNEDKLCDADSVGCERLGLAYSYGNEDAFRDAYKIYTGNADETCEGTAVNCEAWTSSDGVSYFKNPYDMVCEWRQEYGEENSYGWYRKKVKRCEDDGAYCLNDNDCGGSACVLETDDITCEQNSVRPNTFGYGGLGRNITQPEEGWAGLCPAGEAGCTEYIDPRSSFNDNYVVDGGVELDPYTLYVFENSSSQSVSLTCDESNIYRFSGVSLTNSVGPVGSESSVLFYTSEPDTGSLRISCSLNSSEDVSIRKAVIDYKFKQDTDKTTCNGVEDYENGCVYFNERTVEAASMTGLSDNLHNDGIVDSNALLRVTQDRICDEWLACRSYAEDADKNQTCFDVGLCNSLDESGKCDNFIVSETGEDREEQYYDIDPTTPTVDIDGIRNMTGYVKLGYKDGNSLNADMYKLSEMEQVGEVGKVSNGDFEIYGDDGYPLGWYGEHHEGVGTGRIASNWKRNLFHVVDNPVEAEEAGIKYPVHGKGMLEYSHSVGMMVSDFIDVQPNTSYSLSAMVNTANMRTGGSYRSARIGIGYDTFGMNGERSFPDGQNWGNDTLECDRSGQSFVDGCSIGWASGKDWEEGKVNFTTGSNTYKIKLKIWSAVGLSDQYQCVRGGRDASRSSGIVGDKDVFFGIPAYCDNRGVKDTTFSTGGSWGCEDTIHVGSGVSVIGDTLSYTLDSDLCSGVAYIDNIRLDPVLENKEPRGGSFGANYVAQECRLYPGDSALSCDYEEDSGIRKKGWPGYCLEHDRYPGNSDACLMWYPIDNVKGYGIEEGAGYVGTMPVYYTTAVDTATSSYRSNSQVTLDDMLANSGGSHVYEVFTLDDLGLGDVDRYKLHISNFERLLLDIHPCSGNQCGTCSGDVMRPIGGNGCSLRADPSNFAFEEGGVRYYFTSYNIRGIPLSVTQPLGHAVNVGLYGRTLEAYRNLKLGISGHEDDSRNFLLGFKDDYLDHLIFAAGDEHRDQPPTQVTPILYFTDYYASEIVQTVTPLGRNKYWSGRVYEGSGHEVNCNESIIGAQNSCGYYADSAPFGAVVPPAKELSKMANPFEWDASELSGVQPLPYETDTKLARMGQEMNEIEEVQSLFVESYGVWQWTDGFMCANGDFAASAGGLVDNCVQICKNGGQCELTDITATTTEPRCSDDISVTCVIDGREDCPNSECVTTGRYEKADDDNNWSPPINTCRASDGSVASSREAAENPVCAYAPTVVATEITPDRVSGTGFVNLKFAAQVDNQQLPLVAYEVEWGDGEKTVVSGIEMNDRQDINNDPFSLYHLYNYYDLVRQGTSCQNDICTPQIRIKLRDNWGWCTGGDTNRTCPGGDDSFADGPEVVVTE